MLSPPRDTFGHALAILAKFSKPDEQVLKLRYFGFVSFKANGVVRHSQGNAP